MCGCQGATGAMLLVLRCGVKLGAARKSWMLRNGVKRILLVWRNGVKRMLQVGGTADDAELRCR